MYVENWKPGTNRRLDQEFNVLRRMIFNDTRYPLWANYTEDAFKECVALSIMYNKNGYPHFCSSILSRPCWPDTAYRILNRMWKVVPQTNILLSLSDEGGILVNEQIRWLKENTDCTLKFVSRETKYWRKFSQREWHQRYGLEFKTTEHKYLTCDNTGDNSCWQYILYQGDDSVLENWRKQDG
jgi:hypothetical protein